MVPRLPVSPLEGLHLDFTPQQAEEVPHRAGITVAVAAAQHLAHGFCGTFLPQAQHDGPPLTGPAKEGLRRDQGGATGQPRTLIARTGSA